MIKVKYYLKQINSLKIKSIFVNIITIYEFHLQFFNILVSPVIYFDRAKPQTLTQLLVL